ncbi:MAG: ankyrin repeat domain-containing protein [Planctomycetota bacterium]
MNALIRRVSWILVIVGVTRAPLTDVFASEGRPHVVADAAEAKSGERVRSLVRRGYSVNAAQVDGMTALHWAAYHEDAALVKYLLAAGANVPAETRYGIRAIGIAARSGNGTIVSDLLEAGADANCEEEGQESVLLMAARAGRLKAVQALVSHGAMVNAKERRGQTPLMWAAAEGHAEVVDFLLAKGAKRDERLKSGFTALLFAVREGHAEVVHRFLKSGVDVHQTLRPPKPGGGAWEKVSDKDTSALLLAVDNGHFELALELVAAGADPNDERSGMAPLHAVTRARKTGRGDGKDGNPPPDGSGRVTSLEFVRQLVKAGADVNRRLKSGRKGKAILCKKGATPFLLASATADMPLLKLLLELGADPKIANVEGCTPFLAAAGAGVRAPGEEPGLEDESLVTLDWLLKLGADVNVVDAQGETVMHAAAYKSAPRIVEFLAERGANMAVWNRKNRHGWTPLVIAEGFRPGNFKPSAETIAAFHRVFEKAGVKVPPPRKRRTATSK